MTDLEIRREPDGAGRDAKRGSGLQRSCPAGPYSIGGHSKNDNHEHHPPIRPARHKPHRPHRRPGGAGTGQTDGADAELIRLCAQFVELETEHYLLLRHDPKAPDFGPNYELYERLSDEQQHITEMLEQCEPPTSQAGYAAVSRAALTWAYLDDEGNFEAGDFCDEMLLKLAVALAGDFVWPPRPGSCPTAHWAPPMRRVPIAAGLWGFVV